MACNCIKKIEEDTVREKGAAWAVFEHQGRQKSEITYRPYRKDGQISEYSRQNRFTSVPWKFCPFCGEPI